MEADEEVMVRSCSTVHGGFPFSITRKKKNCLVCSHSIYGGRIITGNPCPICRDEYLVVDYRNVRLISQFINMYNGEILDRDKTGVCQKQWLQIRVALEKAKDHGYLDLDPPFVEYDYDKYRPKERKAEET